MPDLTPLLPPVIKKGDCIGLIAPAGPISPAVFSRGVTLLKDLGLNVFYNEDILEKKAYLAGTDERRLKEFHQLWAASNVNAILSVRGGFGTSRIINQIDFELLKKNPKIFIGFSDLTILLNAIYRKTGLITFHGPMLSTLVRDDQGHEELFNHLNSFSREDIKAKSLEVLRTGQAEGILIGGNLSCFHNLVGTEFMPECQNAILLLEDINEPAYRIDRVLTHLKMLGVLDNLAGIILGQFLTSDLNQQGDIEAIWNRVLELTENIPVWANFPVGHGTENLLLPIGAKVFMDSNAGVLGFPEACCQGL